MTASKQKMFDVNLPAELTLPLVTQALQTIGAKIKIVERTTVFAQKGGSLKSWGEIIAVSITSIDSGKSRIDVVSESALGTTLIDWGANANNIEKFAQSLEVLVADTLASIKRTVQEVTMYCPTCSRQFPAGVRFCPNDGTALVYECSSCGQRNTADSKFCVKCGRRI